MRKLIRLDREAVTRAYLTPLSTLDCAKMFGCCAEMIRRKLKEWGVPRHPAKNLPRPQPKKARKMEANGFWKGGTTVDREGYILVKNNDHPDANHLGYVRAHRLAMELKIGRPLLRGEVVHHKDGDTQNNDPDNLELFASNATHLAETLRGKCPKWSEEGYQRMKQHGQEQAVKLAAIQSALKAYAQTHSETPRHFLASLSAEERHLCRMAVELGRYESLAELGQERETIRRAWLALQSPRNKRIWGRKWGYQH